MYEYMPISGRGGSITAAVGQESIQKKFLHEYHLTNAKCNNNAQIMRKQVSNDMTNIPIMILRTIARTPKLIFKENCAMK